MFCAKKNQYQNQPYCSRREICFRFSHCADWVHGTKKKTQNLLKIQRKKRKDTKNNWKLAPVPHTEHAVTVKLVTSVVWVITKHFICSKHQRNKSKKNKTDLLNKRPHRSAGKQHTGFTQLWVRSDLVLRFPPDPSVKYKQNQTSHLIHYETLIKVHYGKSPPYTPHLPVTSPPTHTWRRSHLQQPPSWVVCFKPQKLCVCLQKSALCLL